ncbi:hypothetical protein C0J52_14484 [Blattella germanica]|nr:hypothetical protein C0J52_14484 [Blattella germanica]
MNLYHMELYRDEVYNEPMDFASSDPSATEAAFDETLYVKAWIDGETFQTIQGLRPYVDKFVSTAQQLASKGPLRPVPRRRRVPSLQAEGRPKIIYVGVSTEVTVGIALASFVIGVGLTGALWCIHMKTDPFRRQVDKQLPGSRAVVGTGVVTGCNLSPHSGCSSTNSQAAMTAT